MHVSSCHCMLSCYHVVAPHAPAAEPRRRVTQSASRVSSAQTKVTRTFGDRAEHEVQVYRFHPEVIAELDHEDEPATKALIRKNSSPGLRSVLMSRTPQRRSAGAFVWAEDEDPQDREEELAECRQRAAGPERQSASMRVPARVSARGPRSACQ